MHIQLLLTGDELMTGVTVDSNSAAIAQKLSQIGAKVDGKVTVGDDLSTLITEIKRLSILADVLIINGGLGPTVDDLTAVAVAKAAQVEITEHPEAMAHLIRWCGQGHQRLVNDANRKQAQLPHGCEVIANPIGSAVGFRLHINNCWVLCTPGVPSELKHMLDNSIVPMLSKQSSSSKIVRQSRFHVFGLGESGLQQRINNIFPDWPPQIDLGFRAGLPTLEVKLTSKGKTLDKLHDEWCEKLTGEIGDYIVNTGDQRLPATIVELLMARDKFITTAESCTGGLIASQITSIAGSSNVFEAGYVTYSNEMKIAMLGVEKETLAQHGAVSEPVVREMLAGALQRSHADIGVAVSGVAGPTGGSPEKPVGTVWLAWGAKTNIRTKQFFVPRSRYVFQQLVAAIGLDLVRRDILGIGTDPCYYPVPIPEAHQILS